MRGMTGTSRGLLVLGVGGAAIALIANFGPYLSPLPLDPTITPVGSLFALVGSLLWAAAMVAAYARDPRSPLWKLILATILAIKAFFYYPDWLRDGTCVDWCPTNVFLLVRNDDLVNFVSVLALA